MGEGYKATLEWGFWKFIKYLIIAAIIAWLLSWASTRFLDLDIITWNWLVAVHLANLWLFIPEAFTTLGILSIWKWSKYSEKRSRQRRWQSQMDRQLREADGGEQQ